MDNMIKVVFMNFLLQHSLISDANQFVEANCVRKTTQMVFATDEFVAIPLK